MMVKRLPKSKSGRILVAIRNRMLFDPFVTSDKVKKIEKLNQRIQNRLVSEDQRNHTQVMFTDYRTKLEYIDTYGGILQAVFTGTIDEAQKTLNLHRKREDPKGSMPVIRWAHFTKGNEMIMSGMFQDVIVVKYGLSKKV
jgi:hypothetical protein